MSDNELFPDFYRCYVDDTFCLFQSLEKAEQFLQFVNTLDDSLKFTMEVEVDSKLEFLDTIVNKSNNIGNGLPIFNVRERETNKGLYFNYES